MTGSLELMEVVGRISAKPDPAVLKAIGLNHSLESAVADLIDNSIDAGATRVLARFVIQAGLAHQLIVIDNGRGMNHEQIDAAMVLGIRRDRPDDELGHFGMGLKAASFSQASTLTVVSRTGDETAARRMPRESDDAAWAVYELDPIVASRALDGEWTDFRTPTGTAIVWDDVRTFPKSKDAEVTNSYIETKVSALRSHLGLVFHRLLTEQRLRIEVDVLDVDEDEAGFPFEVEPIDPFGYVRAGADGYPKTLTARTGGATVDLTCHIWPGRSESHKFKLSGMGPNQHQGFYLYRNDRLLSVGGWSGVATATNRRRLARVAIDIDGHDELLVMSMEKSGVQMAATLVHAIEVARDAEGSTFNDFLEEAESVLRQSNKRSMKRTEMLAPGQGISPRVKRAIEREIPILEGEEPIKVRWRRFSNDDFVAVDRPNQVLWLNERYRPSLLKGASGSLNDAPMLKALLYLVYEDIFRGTFFGPKDKDNVAMWRAILNAAAREEQDMYGE